LSRGARSANLLSNGIGALKRRVPPAILAGEKIGAMAITESCGSSDAAGLRTSARLEGGERVVNGWAKRATFVKQGGTMQTTSAAPCFTDYM
jgi:acyl-CoA dehydrogenase